MPDIFAQRRNQLLKTIGDGACLMFNPSSVRRTGDSHYPFRSRSDFIYLTNFAQENSAFLLIGGADPQFILFTTPNTPQRELWNGPLPSFDELKENYGADDVHDINDFQTKIPELVQNIESFWFDFKNDDKAKDMIDTINQHRQVLIRAGHAPLSNLHDVSVPLAELRLIKDDECLSRMRQAANITHEAHIEAMKACRPGLHERQIEAILEFTFRRLGGTCPAYTSIVGGGANACVLHYTENKDVLKDGELLLIDAGVEYKNYACDVTRTFPINGQFSKAQKDIYSIVLKAQLAGISAARSGNTFQQVHETCCRSMAQDLVDLGLLTGDPDELITDDLFRKYFPHGTGHWLGMDVHDVGRFKINDKSRTLEPGMVMTVEPGLYFSPAFDEVPEPYRGIGIRIEDDVLITSGEPEVLTADIPKNIEDIESIMAEKSFYKWDNTAELKSQKSN